MRVLFSPQLSEDKIEYSFEGETITATLNGMSDTFDFSEFPNGRAENINSTLPIKPIVSAERKDGELYVVLLNYIDEDATEEERFPTWQVIVDG